MLIFKKYGKGTQKVRKKYVLGLLKGMLAFCIMVI